MACNFDRVFLGPGWCALGTLLVADYPGMRTYTHKWGYVGLRKRLLSEALLGPVTINRGTRAGSPGSPMSHLPGELLELPTIHQQDESQSHGEAQAFTTVQAITMLNPN